MATINQLLLNNEHRLLGLMLFFLLAATQLGDSSTIAKSFLIIHFGLFLLWQPLIKQQLSFNLKQLILLVLLIFTFVYWFNPWLNAFWSLLLLTLLTGRIFARGLARFIYGLAVITLFLDLILLTTPNLFKLAALSSSLESSFSIIILLLPLTLVFIPEKKQASNQLDFLRGFLVVILIIFLCMSSVLISLTAQQPYIESLATSVFIVSLFLLITAFLWTPRAGFKGLAQLWEKYILNIGGPFEQWITHVSTLEANAALLPSHFLSTASRYLMQQHWVSGVQWNTDTETNFEGKKSTYRVDINDEKLNITLFTFTPVGPSLLLHAKLLLSVLTFYYRAKIQEQQLIKQAHLQAIYETGSKLTHDVKNILQSTQTMTQIINDTDSEMQEIVDVIKRQMPLLTQRLNSTLEKLRAPASIENIADSASGSLLHWWNQLQTRYTGRHIKFTSNVSVDQEIPLDIFTTVVENLLDNARNKRIREPDLKINIQLTKTKEMLSLIVTDTGSAIPTDVFNKLFKEVVSSNDGFGIGLYQSYELANNYGYHLSIKDNADGQVSFELK